MKSALVRLVTLGLVGSTGVVWAIVPSPNLGNDFNRLDAVAAASPSDVWAVGLTRNTPSGKYRTLVEHFNGTAWAVVSSPTLGPSAELRGVDASGASDAWAVGQFFDGSSQRTMAEHFDGSTWSISSTPNVGAGTNVLRGVGIVSPSDVWAVGSSIPVGGGFAPLAMHFNGSGWTVVHTPVPPGGGFFTSIAVVAANDVWAVGGTGDDGDNALLEHWNGSVWTLVTAPTFIGEESLNSVVALSPSDVWAVGHAGTRNLAEHWDGTRWQIVPTPNKLPSTSGNNFLTGVTAVSPTDVWAVGATLDFVAGSLLQTTTLHYDGTSWGIVDSPNAGSGDNQLLGVTALDGGSLVAVGSFRPTRPAHDRTLILSGTDAGASGTRK